MENTCVETELQRRARKLNQAIKDNSLSIVLFVLFVICISAQTFAGWRLQNETLAAHEQASIGYWQFLSTGAFLEGLASNWQAAVLQLGSLIVLSSFLYQRARRIPAIRARRHASTSGGTPTASAGSTAIRCRWRSCCCFCSRLRCTSSSAPTRTMRNARLRASRRSPSRRFRFRLNSGR